MTLNPTAPADDGRVSPMKRRGFLAVLGGTGIGAAVAVFGGAAQAEATYPVGCCGLAHPNSGNVSYCLSKSHYIWYCNNGGQNYCDCCEVKNASGGYIRSDAACYEGG